jgi:hypothetical protein
MADSVGLSPSLLVWANAVVASNDAASHRQPPITDLVSVWPMMRS